MTRLRPVVALWSGRARVTVGYHCVLPLLLDLAEPLRYINRAVRISSLTHKRRHVTHDWLVYKTSPKWSIPIVKIIVNIFWFLWLTFGYYLETPKISFHSAGAIVAGDLALQKHCYFGMYIITYKYYVTQFAEVGPCKIYWRYLMCITMRHGREQDSNKALRNIIFFILM